MRQSLNGRPGRRARRLCLVLAALLLLAGCSQGETPDPEPPPQVEAQGLFPYYTMGGMYGYYGSIGYGLLNAQGEFVLEQVYQSVSPVYGYYYGGTYSDHPLEGRYFVASRYGEITPEMEAQMEREGWVNPDLTYALVSPEGELLTGFEYLSISMAKASAPQPFVALRTDKRFVRLDARGGELPLEDPDEEWELLNAHRYLIRDYWDFHQREGPDVPEEGFSDVLELRDGRYWGGYYRESEEDEFGKFVHEFKTQLFSADGVLLSDHVYTGFYDLGGGLYMATGENELGETEYYLTDENGVSVTGQAYDVVWYDSVDPYLVVQQDDTVTVLEREGLRFHFSFRMEPGVNGWCNTRNGRPYMELFDDNAPARIVFLDQPGEELALVSHPGFSISDIDESYEHFVLYKMVDWEKNPEEQSYYVLVDLAGNELLRSDYTIYATEGVLLMNEYRPGDWSFARNGLYTWEGEQLLPMEYSQMNVLPGGALHVVRGDWTGLIDYSGNWIYRESLFQGLE